MFIYRYVVLVAQEHPTLCDPLDCSSPDSSVHGIVQARIILEWVAIPFSREIFPTQGDIYIYVLVYIYIYFYVYYINIIYIFDNSFNNLLGKCCFAHFTGGEKKTLYTERISNLSKIILPVNVKW